MPLQVRLENVQLFTFGIPMSALKFKDSLLTSNPELLQLLPFPLMELTSLLLTSITITT